MNPWLTVTPQQYQWPHKLVVFFKPQYVTLNHFFKVYYLGLLCRTFPPSVKFHLVLDMGPGRCPLPLIVSSYKYAWSLRNSFGDFTGKFCIVEEGKQLVRLLMVQNLKSFHISNTSAHHYLTHSKISNAGKRKPGQHVTNQIRYKSLILTELLKSSSSGPALEASCYMDPRHGQ